MWATTAQLSSDPHRFTFRARLYEAPPDLDIGLPVDGGDEQAASSVVSSSASTGSSTATTQRLVVGSKSIRCRELTCIATGCIYRRKNGSAQQPCGRTSSPAALARSIQDVMNDFDALRRIVADAASTRKMIEQIQASAGLKSLALRAAEAAPFTRLIESALRGSQLLGRPTSGPQQH
jgi:hypothetical protein